MTKRLMHDRAPDRRTVRGGGLDALEARVLDGDAKAMRALVRQACGPNTLDLRFDNRVELRSVADGTGGDALTFTGYASVVDAPYVMADWLGDYTEVVRGGAFDKTLSESPDVLFCVNHDWDAVPMARTATSGTLRLAADATGLHVEADLDGTRSDVHILRSAMESGALDAMSFAFYVVRQMWSPDFEQRDIQEIDLNGGDTSVVTWPANPATTGTTALRKRAALSLMRSRVPGLIVARARAEKRAGAALSAATLDVLTQVLDLIHEADVAVDAAQPLLAELMGVPNPDADDPDNNGTTPDADTEAKSLGPDPAIVRERLRLIASA